MSQEEHYQEEESSVGSNVAWFLTGAFIGAAIAILYAPKSGKETRHFLAEKVQQSKDAVTESSNNIVEASKDMFERGRQLVDDAADLFERGRKLVKVNPLSTPSPSSLESIAVGDFEVARVNAAVHWWDGGVFFGVVPKTLWSRAKPPDERNRIAVAFNCYLVRTGEHNILIETGLGDKRDARARELMNVPAVTENMPETLARRGIDPDSIDIVVNSHLHWDHVSGNTIVAGDKVKPAFPRARYVASRGEWEHAHERHPRDVGSYLDANYDPLVESGQMMLVDSDYEVAPGVWMRRAPGHNRDMMVVTAESRGKTFCFFSDLIVTAAHVKPTWVAAVDLSPMESIESKLRWLAAAADGEWQCAFSHETDMPFTRIVRDAKTQFAAI